MWELYKVSKLGFCDKGMRIDKVMLHRFIAPGKESSLLGGDESVGWVVGIISPKVRTRDKGTMSL